jgi:hypothetical protein
MMEETFRDSRVGFGGVGRTRYESTSVDEIHDLFARNWSFRVVWRDSILVVPITWDSNVADFVDLLCVLNVPKNEVGTGLDPNPIYIGPRPDFQIVRGWLPYPRGPVGDNAYIRSRAKRSGMFNVLVNCLQDCSRHPDDNGLLYSKLGVYPTPGEEPDGEPER